MGYLLDTNIVSNLVNYPDGVVAHRLRDMDNAEVAISIIVAAELRFGTVKRNSARLTRRIGQVLSAFEVLPFAAPADAFYAALRSDLETRGQPISANDMLIAAHALALAHTLVTANQREFGRIPGLRCENWLAAG